MKGPTKRRDNPVAATLRKWRAEKSEVLGVEYTQQHVATALGVKLRTVQSWDQGLRCPGAGIDRDELAAAYGVSVERVRKLLGD